MSAPKDGLELEGGGGRARPAAETPFGPPPPEDGIRRVVIDRVLPELDGGRHPVKRALGDRFTVEADLLVDGHDLLGGVLLYRRRGEQTWREAPLEPAVPVGNDRWRGTCVLDAVGRWEYTVSAWIDSYATWAWELERKVGAGQQVEVELQSGASLLAAAAVRAGGAVGERLADVAARVRGAGEERLRAQAALDREVVALMRAHADRGAATTRVPPLEVTVDRERGVFSAWYEMFPRSCGPAGRHGTLRDAESRLPYIAAMGFDIVYLPPVHPIGLSHRKGPNNTLNAGPGDPGSPWAIGAREGGHKSVHPELGTLDDFRHFVAAAREHGLEVAIDIAFQASPDHPYVAEHPDWFVRRADGSIQYAENPPKKYQDVYPFNFTGPGWQSLWEELRSVFFHWIEQGVRIFRVDNPHTKPLRFWRWCIDSVTAAHPDVLFLSEAFTRPKMMYALAKAGFTQSYTYFTWRTTKQELTFYLQTLVDAEVREFFRPSFWPNTPDILPEHLQYAPRGAFITRAVLASTLSPSWGIYGPAFELQERVPRESAEEYIDNEKYQLRGWDLDRPDSLRPVLKRLNQIRRDNPALHRLAGTVFHQVDNEMLLCYSRLSEDAENALLVVVNLDPHHKHAGWLRLDLGALKIAPDEAFQAHDLIGDARYLWRGEAAYVELDPHIMPAHIFRLRRRLRSERSFEYFL